MAEQNFECWVGWKSFSTPSFSCYTDKITFLTINTAHKTCLYTRQNKLGLWALPVHPVKLSVFINFIHCYWRYWNRLCWPIINSCLQRYCISALEYRFTADRFINKFRTINSLSLEYHQSFTIEPGQWWLRHGWASSSATTRCEVSSHFFIFCYRCYQSTSH